MTIKRAAAHHLKELARTHPVFWWRTADGQEVDFVLEAPRGLVAVECKAREAPKDGDDRGVKAFMRECGEDVLPVWFLTASRPHPSKSGWPGGERNGVGKDLRSLIGRFRRLDGGDGCRACPQGASSAPAS